MKIAVIGSGIAGLSAAFFLARRHEVVLFEQDRRAGGHTNTIEVPTAAGVQPVDTGWIVYNGINYPNLTALFGELGVQTRPTSMSFGVSLNRGAYEWKGSDRLLSVFAQPANLLRPGHLRLLSDILRLNRVCRRLLKADALPGGSLGDFLRDAGFSAELQARYLLPMAGMIWSCSPRMAMVYPAADFMRFFDAHSLFTATQQPTWHTVIGGSHTYVKALLERFAGTLRLNAAVTRVERVDGSIDVSCNDKAERFDRVVCATHTDQALRLIAGASSVERELLEGIPYSESRVVLHTDDGYLPRRRHAWASWNYINDVAFSHSNDVAFGHGNDEASGAGTRGYAAVDFDREVHDRRIEGSYWMNLLQGIDGPTNYVVTLNPTRPIAAERILYDTTYHHPHYGPASVSTHRRLAGLQGGGGLWWAGAWTGYGFHEDGLVSGLRCVAGIDRDCVPAWASGL